LVPCIRQRKRTPTSEISRRREEIETLENVEAVSKSVNVEIPYV
jgi:hypothetical protein